MFRQSIPSIALTVVDLPEETEDLTEDEEEEEGMRLNPETFISARATPQSVGEKLAIACTNCELAGGGRQAGAGAPRTRPRGAAVPVGSSERSPGAPSDQQGLSLPGAQ